MPRRHYASKDCWCKPKLAEEGYRSGQPFQRWDHREGGPRHIIELPTLDWEDAAKTIAQRFTKAREAAGMNRKQLAEASGLPYSKVHGFEKGEYVTLYSLMKLCQTIGVDPGDLLADIRVGVWRLRNPKKAAKKGKK